MKLLESNFGVVVINPTYVKCVKLVLCVIVEEHIIRRVTCKYYQNITHPA